MPKEDERKPFVIDIENLMTMLLVISIARSAENAGIATKAQIMVKKQYEEEVDRITAEYFEVTPVSTFAEIRHEVIP